MREESGITLIELIAVIGIIGIIYLISVPLYNTFQSAMLLKGTAQGVKNYIEQAKSLAMTHNRTFTVTFKLSDQKIETTDIMNDWKSSSDPGEVAAYNQEIADKGAVQTVKDYTIPRQITLSTNAAGNKITVSSAGTMNACSIWIQKNGTDKYYTLTTRSTTGAVAVYPYKKNGS